MKATLPLLVLTALSCTSQPKKVPGAMPVSTPKSSEVEPVCDSGRVIKRASLEDWRRELEAAVAREDDTPPRPEQTAKIKSLFAELGIEITDEQLAPTNPDQGPYGACAPLELWKIQISDAKLTDKESHKLIEINLSVCNEVMLHNTEQTIVAVVSIAGEGAFCEVGQLSSQWIDHACLSPEQFDEQEQPMIVTPIRLLSDRHQDLQVTEEDGRCDFIEREGRFTTSLWTVRDGSLEQIFKTQSFFTEYRSPFPPTQWTETKLTTLGEFPKQLQVQEEVICEPLDPTSEPREGSTCEASKIKRLWRFDGKRYAADKP